MLHDAEYARLADHGCPSREGGQVQRTGAPVMPKRPCAPAQAGERYSVCGTKASALNHCAQALGLGSRSRNAATALVAAAGPDVAHVLAASTAFTRSGVTAYG